MCVYFHGDKYKRESKHAVVNVDAVPETPVILYKIVILRIKLRFALKMKVSSLLVQNIEFR